MHSHDLMSSCSSIASASSVRRCSSVSCWARSRLPATRNAQDLAHDVVVGLLLLHSRFSPRAARRICAAPRRARSWPRCPSAHRGDFGRSRGSGAQSRCAGWYTHALVLETEGNAGKPGAALRRPIQCAPIVGTLVDKRGKGGTGLRSRLRGRDILGADERGMVHIRPSEEVWGMGQRRAKKMQAMRPAFQI